MHVYFERTVFYTKFSKENYDAFTAISFFVSTKFLYLHCWNFFIPKKFFTTNWVLKGLVTSNESVACLVFRTEKDRMKNDCSNNDGSKIFDPLMDVRKLKNNKQKYANIHSWPVWINCNLLIFKKTWNSSKLNI